MTADDRPPIVFSSAGKTTVTHVYTHLGIFTTDGNLARCRRCRGPAIAVGNQHVLTILTPHGQEFLCGGCAAREEDRP